MKETMDMGKLNKGGLRDLHGLIVDSRKGYTEAAKRAGDPRVKVFLKVIADERGGMETELDLLLRDADPDAPPGKGTLKGDLHRAWLELRDALSTTDDVSLLAECARGENFLITRYDELLGKDGFSVAAREVLQRHRAIVKDQAARVQVMHDQVQELQQ